MDGKSWGLAVLKFGSSVLLDEDAYQAACLEIRRWVGKGFRVVAVVSALHGKTDALLAKANSLGPCPDPAAVAAYLAVGEGQSVAWLGLCLDRAGISATVLDAAAIGLNTEGTPLNAVAVSLDRETIIQALERRPVLVVPGFVGRDRFGQVNLLGRGGSDLTALFLAARLEADQCRLLKDVNGLYDRDPALHGMRARRFLRVSFDDVLALDEGIVQHKAVRFAREWNLSFRVTCPGGEDGTLVCGQPSRFYEEVSLTAQTPC